MPEGDSIRRAASRLQALVGERVEVETPNPRAASLGLVSRLDGLRLEAVDAVGKNLLLRFEGGITLRSHLRMKGRWRVQARDGAIVGTPWLVLRTGTLEALQFNGPVLELRGDVVSRLGPDILAEPPDLEEMVEKLRAAPGLFLAEALQHQSLVAGIGNMWVAETLWAVRLSPWLRMGDVSDADLRRALDAAHTLMSASLARGRSLRTVYRRAGRPCRRCGTPIASRGQGDANRTAYWCPRCQPGGESEPRGRRWAGRGGDE